MTSETTHSTLRRGAQIAGLSFSGRLARWAEAQAADIVNQLGSSGRLSAVLVALAMVTAGCSRIAAKPDAPATAATPQQGEPIMLGRSYTLDSQVLGEARTINVYTPPGYGESNAKFPVLYLIDGGVDQDFVHVAGLSQHGSISASFRSMIVVGIATTDRPTELTFAATHDLELAKEYPKHGKSAAFRSFIASEVKPWVETRFATDGHDAVMGESLAGLFVLETFLREPALFDGYVAIDPSLWWDNDALAQAAAERLAAQPAGERTVYMAVAHGVPMMRSGQVLTANALRTGAPAGLSFIYEVMDDEEHSTIYHRAALKALRLVFANAS